MNQKDRATLKHLERRSGLEAIVAELRCISFEHLACKFDREIHELLYSEMCRVNKLAEDLRETQAQRQQQQAAELAAKVVRL